MIQPPSDSHITFRTDPVKGYFAACYFESFGAFLIQSRIELEVYVDDFIAFRTDDVVMGLGVGTVAFFSTVDDKLLYQSIVLQNLKGVIDGLKRNIREILLRHLVNIFRGRMGRVLFQQLKDQHSLRGQPELHSVRVHIKINNSIQSLSYYNNCKLNDRTNASKKYQEFAPLYVCFH